MQLFLWFGSQLNILLGEAYASVKLSHPPPPPKVIFPEDQLYGKLSVEKYLWLNFSCNYLKSCKHVK